MTLANEALDTMAQAAQEITRLRNALEVAAGARALALQEERGKTAAWRAKAEQFRQALERIANEASNYGDGADDSTAAAKAHTRIHAMATDALEAK